jgi:catechol 2,3-dioxygenase-like lactoylglutathione lyase family enzyme
VDWTLELIVVPVSDIDRAKAFYVDGAGFVELVDVVVGEGMRVVQLTPPGSGCAIALMNTTPMAPGSIYGLHLIVPDIEAARAELTGRGVEVSDFFHFGPQGQVPGLAPDRSNYNSFASFRDPDGSTWLVQEVDRTRVEAAGAEPARMDA